MKNIKLEYLAPSQHKKRGNKLCKYCNKLIITGSNYISVHYKDSYITKGFGAFHMNCWEEFKNEKSLKE